MAKTYLKLQPSESAVLAAASRIYSAYIACGKVTEGDEKKWIDKSIREAIDLANSTDATVISDGEVD